MESYIRVTPRSEKHGPAYYTAAKAGLSYNAQATGPFRFQAANAGVGGCIIIPEGGDGVRLSNTFRNARPRDGVGWVRFLCVRSKEPRAL